MTKVMVTGALGNVGSYVIKYLLENKQEVIAADIDIQVLQNRYGNRVKHMYFDFTDETTFVSKLDNIDAVFIMRPPHLGKPKDLKPFIDEISKNKGIQLISFLSLIGVENNPVPPHHKIEKYIEQTGIPYCHIRPSFFM